MAPYSSNRQLRFCRPVLSALLLCVCLGGARAEQSVQDLRYGVTLFHFYQQDYFEALTELMAAQQLKQLPAHGHDAELLRGGISLSYGMDRLAEEIFTDVLASPGRTEDRNQAWFYLGKMAWHRGDLARADAALARLTGDGGGELDAEADYLRASIDLRQGDVQAAATLLQGLPEESSWRYYLYYNLGAVNAAQGEWAASLDFFRQFQSMQAQSDETRVLRDKAFTAAGFASMAAGEFDHAGTDFAQVRLDSPLSGRALLGYGWALSEQGDYQAALSPWMALGERSMLGQSARESLLAIPYAYEQLDRPALALASYEQASVSYHTELDHIYEAIEVFRLGDIDALLGLADEAGGDWLFGADILPEGPYAPYLQHLVSQHGFQVALRELRDLHHISGQLDRAAERLDVLSQVDRHQQHIWATVVQGNRRQELARTQQALLAKVGELRQRLERAEQQGDTRLLADGQQGARWLKLERTGELAVRLGAGADKMDKLRLMRGLMIWEDNEQYPARLWQLRREMAELETLAARSTLALQSVDQAIEQRRRSDFAPRIEQLALRVQQRSADVDRVTAASELAVRLLAVAELERQAEQISRSLGQTRLAIARLYDRGSPEVPR